MRVLLTSEAKFERAADGPIWASSAEWRAIWSRYSTCFRRARPGAGHRRSRTIAGVCSGLGDRTSRSTHFRPIQGSRACCEAGGTSRRSSSRAVAGCPAISFDAVANCVLAARMARDAAAVWRPDRRRPRSSVFAPARSVIRCGPAPTAATSAQRQIARGCGCDVRHAQRPAAEISVDRPRVLGFRRGARRFGVHLRAAVETPGDGA